MHPISWMADLWIGLCRKPPVVRTVKSVMDIPTVFAHEGLPDGGGGGSGSIRRGIGAVLSGMRTLNRNRNLLWFTLLFGLVLAGNSIGHAAFRYINRTLQPERIVLYAQDFVLIVATLFCLVFLFAALILSISSKTERHVSFLEGLCEAKKYQKTLFTWTLILALAAFLLDSLYVFATLVWFPHELGFLYTIMDGSFVRTITEFPFNWTLDWGMLTEVPGYGGRSLLLLVYPFGVLETLHFSVITIVLFILTPFVVPLIVLEKKTLKEVIRGSCALQKKVWAEISAGAVFIGGVVLGVFFIHRLIQVVSGIVDPFNTVIFHPSGSWIAVALIYNFALLIVAFVMITIGGIAVLDLYRSAKAGQIPGIP